MTETTTWPAPDEPLAHLVLESSGTVQAYDERRRPIAPIHGQPYMVVRTYLDALDPDALEEWARDGKAWIRTHNRAQLQVRLADLLGPGWLPQPEGEYHGEEDNETPQGGEKRKQRKGPRRRKVSSTGDQGPAGAEARPRAPRRRRRPYAER